MYILILSLTFDLERGLPAEETKREHLDIKEYKAITNFDNTKEVLNSIKLDLPEVPDIKDLKRIMINRDEKIAEKIIKPKDELIEVLYQNNLDLSRELLKQAKLVDIAEKYQKEKNDILAENEELKNKCRKMEEDFDIKVNKIRTECENETKRTEKKLYGVIDDLYNENNRLNKIIDRFKETVSKFIKWVCNKFAVSSEEQLMRNFQKETNINFKVEEQIDYEISRDEEEELDLW